MRDCELLREYADNHSDTAFAELVARHVNLVYSTAHRMVGDSHLAKDVSQMVFIGLARQPHTIRQPDALSGWLYGATRRAASQILRTENRRRNRETQAMTLSEPDQNTPAAWTNVGPLLDEAMSQLKPIELNAVVLRFFEGKSLEETGRALELSENAAQKRVANALEKLRVFFLRRGVTVSSALLTTAIATNSVQAAPVGLAASVTGASLASAGAAASAGSLAKTVSTALKAKAALVAAVVIVAATTITVTQQRKINRLQTQLAAAQVASAPTPLQIAAASATTAADRVAIISRILKSNKTRADVIRDLLDFFTTLKPEDFSPLLDAYHKLPNTLLTDLGRELLLAYWAKTNPADAFAWVQANADASTRNDDLNAVFQSWASEDSAAAFAALNQIDDPAARSAVQSMLFAWMSLHDPEGAFAMLHKLPLGQQTVESYVAIFYAWADQNPAAASAAALKLPASVARIAAIEAVATAWAQQDPKAAIAWADALPAGVGRIETLGAALMSLSKNNPQAATAYLDKLPNGSLRNDFIDSIATNWAAKDPAAALAWIGGIDAGQSTQDKAVESIMQQMEKTDPSGAATFLSNVTAVTVLNVAVPQLASSWAQQDIHGALAWVQSLPVADGAARNQAFQNVLSTWMQSDPAAAAAYVQTISADPSFNVLASQLAKNWAAADPQAATAWAQSLPPSASQTGALQAALIAYAAVDPQTAWNTALTMPDDSDGNNYRLRTLSNIAAVWSVQDPAYASTLIPQIPQVNTSLVANAAQAVAANWVMQDPEAASKWVDSLPDGGIRDHAVVALITVEGKNDPATAFKWARSMRQGTGMRQPLINALIQDWAKRDPAAATKAIQDEPNMADDRKTELLNMISRNAPNTPDNSGPTSDTRGPAP